MPVPSTVEEFLEIGRKSGILEKQALDAYVSQMREESALPATPAQLANRMVKDGLVTNLQAELFLQGKWRRFQIAGKYVLLDRLGAGGMGTVYLCEHKVMRRRVALKVLPARHVNDPAALERFRREARAAAQLDHPNIVHAHDIDHDGNLHFLVMEYVDGSSLQDIVAKRGPMDALRAAHYICQAALGLQHAHEAGLVHRDVKPANLLLDRAGTIKIMDMGLARFFHEDADNLTREHDSHTVLGTADYLAPEQAIDSHAVDIRADIYSLGVTFYFLLTAKSPFQDGTLVQKLLWHQVRKPRPVREVRPEVSAELERLLDRMLAKDPADRFQTPAEVAQALEPFVREPVAPPPAEEMPTLCPALRGPANSGASGVLSRSGITRVPPRTGTNSTSLSGCLAPASTRPEAPPAPPKVARRRLPMPWAVAAGVTVAACGIGAGAYSLLAGGSGSPKHEEVNQGNREPVRRKVAPPAAFQPVQAPPAGELRRFKEHATAIECLALAPDGRRLLTGGQDKVMLLWELPSGKVLHTFRDFKGIVYCVAFSPDGRQALSACGDGTLRLWDVDKRKEVRRFAGHTRSVNGAAFAPDGRRAASAGDDMTVRVWDVANGKELARGTGHTRGVWYVTWSPDGRHVLSAGKDGTVRLWDAATGKEVRKFLGHAKEVRRVAFSPDGRRILSGGFDTTFRLWDTGTGGQLGQFDGGGCIVESVKFSPDGRYAFATEGPQMTATGMVVGKDHGFRIWDLRTGRLLHRLGGVPGKVFQLALLPGASQALTVSSDGLVRLWQLPPLEEGEPVGLVRRLEGHTGPVDRVAVSPDGRYALSAGLDKTARLWDLRTGREVGRLEGHTGSVHFAAFAPDGTRAVTTSDDHTCRVWDLQTSQEVCRFEGHQGRVWAGVFTPDGKQVFSAGVDRTARLWEADTGREIRRFAGHDAPINSVALSPDGRLALTASWDHTVAVWDVATGAEVGRFTGHTASVRTVAFLPDGRHALSAGSDRVLRLWEVDGCRQVRTFVGHPADVWIVAVSPDGQRAASGGVDRTVRVWEVATGRPVVLFGGHTEQIPALAFTPDGRRLVSGSYDKTVRVWGLPGR